jgi:hypothetical protein
VIHDDRDSAGHVFTYDQVVDGRRGVTLTIHLREEPA